MSAETATWIIEGAAPAISPRAIFRRRGREAERVDGSGEFGRQQPMHQALPLDPHTCHALARTSDVVRQHWPEWHDQE